MHITVGDIAYYLLKMPVKGYLRWRFNISVEGSLKGAVGAYLLVGNHVTNEDPLLANVYAGRLIRFITGDANQDHWLKRVLLSVFEGIPFTKNAGDAKSIRALIRHTSAGHPVGLYPEGGRNWDGATDMLVPATAKLVKLLKAPVYSAIIKGGYLSRPRWADHPRKGKLVMVIRPLLCQDEIAAKTATEIQAILVEGLAHDEFQWQQQRQHPFKGKKLAECIERLLYICPSCMASNSICSKGDEFYCRTCGRRYAFNQYGAILGCSQFTDTVAWNRWQRQYLPEIAARGFAFVNERMLFWRKETKESPWRRDLVTLRFTADRLEISGQKVKETVLLSNIRGFSITFQDLVEFYQGQTKYRFRFDPRKHMSVKLFYDLVLTIGKGSAGS